MITSIDTNILIALWDDSDAMNLKAQRALDLAYEQGSLVISGAVFVELLAAPGRTSRMIENFLSDTETAIDWTVDETIWRTAGRAYQNYAKRRRKQKQPEPKRFVVDFLIGAHALERGYRLLTLDNRIFKAAFPNLRVAGA